MGFVLFTFGGGLYDFLKRLFNMLALFDKIKLVRILFALRSISTGVVLSHNVVNGSERDFDITQGLRRIN